MQNGLQLNPDKSEALILGTATQLRAVSSLTPVSVAGVDLPVADTLGFLGVTVARRLTFDDYASAVVRSCHYHARAIRHIRHLLTLDLAQTLACSLILSRIYNCKSATLCCTALHPALFRSCSEHRTPPRVSYCRPRDDEMPIRSFGRCIGCPSNSASTTS